MIEEHDHLLVLVTQTLLDIEHATKCEDAVRLSQELYNVARTGLPEDEIIKAIERRLPTPRKEYAESISLKINQGKLIMTRPIGELEGRIIYVYITPEGAYFGDVKAWAAEKEIPTWDITSPKNRRSRRAEA